MKNGHYAKKILRDIKIINKYMILDFYDVEKSKITSVKLPIDGRK
jgi:hypothetical protein